ncbi:ribosome maturation factor [Geothermobacter hydrogeniphilus]|uniref:Ribosome maturation factor RimP n=1 Tax=Geothermobacter hydrogeniphilus TaxID=1969733 RepID=A0A2K2HD48_9BACT|nr:ribosome maturation factor RimP [Geothermobacter hydrogeniphilus]PNU21210.1 ribosome maturation factor [Geothermobacter hydrogeniphilus]
MVQQVMTERVAELVAPIIEEFGLELVDVEYKRERSDWFLRLFIDKPGGVTLDDCADLSREVDPLLEVEGLIPHAYRLEVSSPGLDRPLKKAADFARFVGERIRVKSRDPLDPDHRGHARKTFRGILQRADGESLTIAQQDKRGGEVTFRYDELAEANLDPQF